MAKRTAVVPERSRLIDVGTRLVRVQALLSELADRLDGGKADIVIAEALCAVAETEVERMLENIFEIAQPQDQKALQPLSSY